MGEQPGQQNEPGSDIGGLAPGNAAPDAIPPFNADDTQSRNMEVHKHPHHVTHKKKWNEYVLEFLMLFLAVFLGFLAETKREQIVEKHREKQFMHALVRDLQLDTMQISISNRYRTHKFLAGDSLLTILSAHRGGPVPALAYYYSRRIYGNINFFQNSGTLDQLKNSGGMRLISQRSIVDSIESYDRQIRRMVKRDDMEVEYFVYNNRLSDRLFDAGTVNREFGYSLPPPYPADTTRMIPVNAALMNEYILDVATYVYLIKQNYQVFEENRLKALHLMQLIQQEYPAE
jgi:hypothetical protein